MRVHVAFTPSEAATAELGVVVDVVRATSSIAQALASGYRRVLCCAEVEQARALRASLGGGVVVGGERDAIRIEGFDLGASPREFLEPRAETLILSTTNGTRAILAAAERSEEVLLGSLLNLEAVAAAARERTDPPRRGRGRRPLRCRWRRAPRRRRGRGRRCGAAGAGRGGRRARGRR